MHHRGDFHWKLKSLCYRAFQTNEALPVMIIASSAVRRPTAAESKMLLPICKGSPCSRTEGGIGGRTGDEHGEQRGVQPNDSQVPQVVLVPLHRIQQARRQPRVLLRHRALRISTKRTYIK